MTGEDEGKPGARRHSPAPRVVPWRRGSWRCPVCGHGPAEPPGGMRAIVRCAGKGAHVTTTVRLPGSTSASRRVNDRFGITIELAMITRLSKVMRVRPPAGFAEMSPDEVRDFLHEVYVDDNDKNWALDPSWGAEEATHEVLNYGSYERPKGEEE